MDKRTVHSVIIVVDVAHVTCAHHMQNMDACLCHVYVWSMSLVYTCDSSS